MKQVLIIENSDSKLTPVNESVNVKGEKEYVLGGIFTEFNKRNRNDRIYTAESFIPHLNEMRSRINTNPGVVYGEFDHPDNFDISLSRVSHVITEANYIKEENLVRGEIKLLNTKFGKEAKAIVDDGFPIFVSSRAAGVTEANGHVNLKKLFSYDAVADPGFGSAKMEMKNSLNESLGFNANSNFRIFDMTKESNTNELFDMNKNDMVTKKQMIEYSNHITSEMNKMEKMIESIVKGQTSNPDFEKMQKMISEYENLQHVQEKMVGYIEYLSSNLKSVIVENKELKSRQTRIIEHANELADEINENANNAEMLAEHVLNHTNAISMINEDVTDLKVHSDHVVEHLNNVINYGDYITENLVTNIEYTDMLSENLEASIQFGDYLAEHVEAGGNMNDYLAEHLETMIEFGDYIVENVSENIEYIDYIAENVDKTITNAQYIAEKLNKKFKTGLINENEEFEGEEEEDAFTLPEEFGDEMYSDEMEEETPGTEMEMEEETPEMEEEGEDVVACTRDEEGNLIPAVEPAVCTMEPEMIDSVEGEEEMDDTIMETDPMLAGISAGKLVKLDGGIETATVVSVDEKECVVELSESGEQVVKNIEDVTPINTDGEETSLTDTVNDLIEEAKKREASKEKDPHFFMFLNEEQKKNFDELSQDDKEKVILTINESDGYFSQTDVMKLIHKALAVETETIEEKLVKAMPEDVQPIWENLDNKVKRGIFAQARLHNLSTPELLEHFWRTRKALKDNSGMISEGKKQIGGDITTDNSELSDETINFFKNKFDSLK